MTRVEIRTIEAEGLLRDLRRAVVDVWTGAHGIRRGSTLWNEFGDERLPRHARRDGFRMRGAFLPSGELAGFVYGYTGAPGQWWHDRVAVAMPAETRSAWLERYHFELAELAVHPEHQATGIGSLLHDGVLEGLPHEVAVLSALADNLRVIRFYEARGWDVILPELRFEPERPLFCVLGKPLRS